MIRLAREEDRVLERYEGRVGHCVGSGDLNVIEGKNAGIFELHRTVIYPHDVRDRHFGAALARPRPSSYEFQERDVGHEESINLVQEQGDRGRRATGIIRPRGIADTAATKRR